MVYEHLFVMDPLASLNRPLDSSLRMLFELAAKGHGIRVCEPKQLAWSGGDKAAVARCQRLMFAGSPQTFSTGSSETVSLLSFDAVHMRKDPPYDMDYIATTWLLESASSRGVRVYNDPAALRRFNEKLAILLFPEACQAALATSDSEALLAFVENQANGDAILKPLTLFGGRGVERLQLKSDGRAQVLAKLRSATGDGASIRLIQPFNPAIYDGEVRVFTGFGRPLAWCLKRPAPGEFLANTRAGATLEAYEPTTVESTRVTSVASALHTQGVFLTGFDLIGGFVSEINLTSPRLLQAANDRTNYYAVLAGQMEADIAEAKGRSAGRDSHRDT